MLLSRPHIQLQGSGGFANVGVVRCARAICGQAQARESGTGAFRHFYGHWPLSAQVKPAMAVEEACHSMCNRTTRKQAVMAQGSQAGWGGATGKSGPES